MAFLMKAAGPTRTLEVGEKRRGGEEERRKEHQFDLSLRSRHVGPEREGTDRKRIEETNSRSDGSSKTLGHAKRNRVERITEGLHRRRKSLESRSELSGHVPHPDTEGESRGINEGDDQQVVRRKKERAKKKSRDSPSSVAVENQTFLVHSVSNPDNLVLREDRSVQGVLQRNDSGGSRVDVVSENEVGFDIVFEGEVVAIGGRDGCWARKGDGRVEEGGTRYIRRVSFVSSVGRSLKEREVRARKTRRRDEAKRRTGCRGLGVERDT